MIYIGYKILLACLLFINTSEEIHATKNGDREDIETFREGGNFVGIQRIFDFLFRGWGL